MFEVGFTEILLIFGLALLVLGPQKLPELARKVGLWTGRARAMARQLRTQLEHEVAVEELTGSRKAAPASEPERGASARRTPAHHAQPPPEAAGEAPRGPEKNETDDGSS